MTDDASVITFRKDQENKNSSAVIFVHGFTGDKRKTWGDFPGFLMGDTELNHWDIFSVKYKSTLLLPELRGLWKAAPDIQKLADTFATRVKTDFDRYEHLAFIAHSMGGLIVQRALLDCPETRRRTSHLFLFGTPSNGLLKAVIAKKFSGKRQVRDMAAGDPFIVRLRRDWEDKFCYNDFSFYFQTVAGNSDEFVPSDSAHLGFPRAHCETIDGGHLDIVKPKSADNLAVRIVAKGLRERRIQKKTGGDRESESDGQIRREKKLADKSIIIDFDLTEMVAKFLEPLEMKPGPFAFSLSAPASHVGQQYYAKRLKKDFSLFRDEAPLDETVILGKRDAEKPDYLLDRLRNLLGGSIQAWIKEKRLRDLMVFAWNYDFPDETMEAIISKCWNSVMDRYAGLLEDRCQYFVLVWGNVKQNPIAIQADRFHVLPCPEVFTQAQLKTHWQSRLERLGLDALTVSRFMGELTDSDGDIVRSHDIMRQIISKINGGSSSYAY